MKLSMSFGIAAIVVSLLFANTFLAWHFGAKSVVCPPCIEQAKACPAEDIWVNTTYGLVNFEKGEIDNNPPYILRKHDIDEMYRKIEQEILKQKGEAL